MKSKLILTVLIIAIAMMMIGCENPFAGSAVEEVPEEAVLEGELPEWLLYSHRSIDLTGTEEEDMFAKDDGDEAEGSDDNSVGGYEADDTLLPAAQQAPAQQGQEGAAPAQQQQPAETASSSAAPQPGTMDYIIWKNKQRAAKAEAGKEAAEKEDAEAGNWWDMDSGSDSDNSWWRDMDGDGEEEGMKVDIGLDGGRYTN